MYEYTRVQLTHFGMSAYRSRRLAGPSTPLDERHGRCRSQATWPSALPYRLPCRRATARARKAPASDLLWRLADEDCLMGVQLGFMGVQLGGKVIWAGLRGCGCGTGTAGQQQEDVTVLS